MKLFFRHGYAATTIESIAREAKVSVQTVYFSFGNKQQILRDLIDVHAAGEDGSGLMPARPQVAEALSVKDPRQQLRLLARITRTVNERVAPLLEVLRNAAAAYGEAADLWQTNKVQRRLVQRQFVDVLADRELLPEGLGNERALDICYALLGPELYHLLASEREWTQEQWEDWVYEGLCQNLISGGTPARHVDDAVP
ncbi:hypothetical protein AR457_29575 [Streptomyces agglomeratus]|uniref:HTH tetR-type domain-containing protein n=2 Tax=Streptomyces agglomeratus TaxID=285458 RepID=A0A1E5PJS6_9ACTN|nr:hypothetical protein AS594_29460 [Streptomyces agglomeratus]OEJ42195.1 hypothetical protein BGK70_07075 [Streptomyces agglomeratus]OEJ49294.1 hypothetical protein AR457_29575 [Streptomyces agglomeratus]OEJ55509.1 hypothetical protein BGK72_06550 [Streptomyces agglomeratus]OEJ62888.1 hypothetical protein BGM19_07365 [Streptomyces agglomeratus]